MKLINTIFLILGVSLISPGYALQSEHVLWEKVPLTIELPLNQERLLHFPKAIKIIDQQLSPHLDVLKVQGSLYLKAKEAVQESRLMVQLQPDGEVIILNLKAHKKVTDSNPIEIILEESSTDHPSASSHYEYNAIQLTRLAIQALYAPERVRELPEGIYRSPMHTPKTVVLLYGASIEAHPIASWRGGSLYVTAVELKNLLNKEVPLRFKELMGHWQTASFYPKSILLPRSQHESSTVFLVSEQPFMTAMTQQGRFSR